MAWTAAALRWKPAAGRYAALLVRFCLTRNSTPGDISVSWQPWSVYDAAGQMSEPPSSWSSEDIPVPVYPNDRVVPVGRCVQGWIPFERRTTDPPVRVVYDAPDPAAEWQLPTS
jgi:hypothetical protein